MYRVTEMFEKKWSPVLWTPCGSLFSSLLRSVTKRGTRGAIRGSRTRGPTLWRLDFKRAVLDAFTTGPMLCTVLKQLARDCPSSSQEADKAREASFLECQSLEKNRAKPESQGATPAFVLLGMLWSLWL